METEIYQLIVKNLLFKKESCFSNRNIQKKRNQIVSIDLRIL